MKSSPCFLVVLLSLSTGLVFAQPKPNPASFIPKGYYPVDTIVGDLNKDGLEDRVILIKGTDKSKIVQDKSRGELDRNRRGLVILFRKANGWELAMKNPDCFSSENEDGGVYYAPELDPRVERGNLVIHYAHGRYGYWRYTFRFQQGDFKLIGYDESNGGAVVRDQTSINFLTKKKLTKTNTNLEAEGGDEVFKDVWSPVKIDELTSLSEIRDFDELDMSRY